jgi:hypothetical protein
VAGARAALAGLAGLASEPRVEALPGGPWPLAGHIARSRGVDIAGALVR